MNENFMWHYSIESEKAFVQHYGHRIFFISISKYQIYYTTHLIVSTFFSWNTSAYFKISIRTAVYVLLQISLWANKSF